MDTLNASCFPLSDTGKAPTPASSSQFQKTKDVNSGKTWKAPDTGSLKLNVDAAFSKETNKAVMGAVIRDHRGNVVCAMALNIRDCEDAEEAEARALLQALHICSQENIKPHEVETDCAAVWNSCNNGKQNLSRLCSIYREIDSIRCSNVPFLLSLVKRDCNSVAHELAKTCRIEGTAGVWVHSFPAHISPFILDDCNRLMSV